MGSACSRFIRNLTRVKREEDENEDDLDFLKNSRDLPLTTSVQKLVAVCFNCAVFVVVGMAVKQVAGPAMVLSVLLGAGLAILNNLSLTELCTRSPKSRDFYDIVYTNVGELLAFMLGWLRLLQSIVLIALVSYTAGDYIKYLAEPALGRVWSPDLAGWTDIPLDTLVFAVGFCLILSVMVAAGLPRVSAYLQVVCWLGVAVFIYMVVMVLYHANTISWSLPTEFQPYNVGGTVQGVAITMFFFTNLDKIVEQTVYMKRPTSMVPTVLTISLLIVLVYFFTSTIFLALLLPIQDLSDTATLPEAFAQATFHSSKYILVSAGILTFCFVILESYYSAQKVLGNLALDQLCHGRFSNLNNPKKVPFLNVLLLGLLSVPLVLWLSAEDMVQAYCIVSILISILINSSAIVVQYGPEKQRTNKEENGIFPSWQCTKTIIIRFLLCFGYISHKKVLAKCGVETEAQPNHQTSKIVNWGLVFYWPSCIGLCLAMFHGLPVVGWKQWIVLAAVGMMLLNIFVTLRIILMQPRKEANYFKYDFLGALVPLLNVSLLSVLLVSLEWLAFSTVGVWLGVGFLVYFMYGISHSQVAADFANNYLSDGEEEMQTKEGGIQLENSPDVQTKLASVQPRNKHSDVDNYLYSDDDAMRYQFPQKY